MLLFFGENDKKWVSDINHPFKVKPMTTSDFTSNFASSSVFNSMFNQAIIMTFVSIIVFILLNNSALFIAEGIDSVISVILIYFDAVLNSNVLIWDTDELWSIEGFC